MTAKSYLGGKVVVHGGDCLDVLKGLPDSFVDSCVTDPPYALTNNSGSRSPLPGQYTPIGKPKEPKGGFMGKQWDTGERSFTVEFWAEVLRVLKPGGHVLAFGGTRTVHRLACAIEDSGFEIRDQIMWVFGSGFPKSHDVSKGIDRMAGAEREVVGPKVYGNGQTRTSGNNATMHEGWQRPWRKQDPQRGERLTAPATDAGRQWQGWGTALKPAWEPIVLARKPPSEGTVAANVLKHGTGAINVDGCRVATDWSERPESWKRSGHSAKSEADKIAAPPGNGINCHSLGRWPANLIHDGSDEVVAAFPETKALGRFPKNTGGIGTASGIYGKADGRDQIERSVDDGSGSAARFFASFRQENTCLLTNDANGPARRFWYSAKADKDDRLGSSHPTIKPVDLIQYLVRLITPPNGICLDPFAGTGTTGEAAFREGMRAILIEREPEYLTDIERRMQLVLSGPVERSQSSIKARGKTEHAGPLFALPEAAE